MIMMMMIIIWEEVWILLDSISCTLCEEYIKHYFQAAVKQSCYLITCVELHRCKRFRNIKENCNISASNECRNQVKLKLNSATQLH